MKKILLLGVGLVLLNGCSSNVWQTHTVNYVADLSHSSVDISDNVQSWTIDPNSYPRFPVPQNVRPCCAFGDMQKVAIGSVSIPFFRLNNIVEVDDIGPHKFSSGIYHYTRSSMAVLEKSGGENNGLIYTTKGGFIDLAHVRDTADDTIALFFIIFDNLGKDYRIELPTELGPRYIQLQEFDASKLTPQQHWSLAANLAARMAYLKAESHEIAQWHGYASFSQWSETISAYSLEDLYSNMLGAILTLDLVIEQNILNEADYNKNMTLQIDLALRKLNVVSRPQTQALLNIVDGSWWDSSKSIPNKYMLLKRHYQLGDHQIPYLVTEKKAQKHSNWHQVESLYPTSISPLSLPERYGGYALDDLAELRLEIDDKYATTFAHIPQHIWTTGFNQSQFLTIAQYAEKEDEKELQQLNQRLAL